MHVPSLCNFIFTISIFLSLTSPTHQLPLAAPISKDDTTQHYTLSLYIKTPPQPTKLHLHLGSSLTWLLCDSTYTNNHIPCNSSLCTSFISSTCSNNTCFLFPENPLTRTTLLAAAATDSLALPTFDFSTHSPLLRFSNFLFSCATAHLLQGLASNATGLVSLGRSNYSLPAQISTALSSPNSFTLCLPSSSSNPGSAFFSTSTPNFLSSKINLTFSHTPLIINPVPDTVLTDTSQPSDEYFINLTSIKINGKPLPINTSLLTVDENGLGGTKISTSEPYTVLETSIYKLMLQLFVNESLSFNLTATEIVEPFGLCYPAAGMTETRVGPAVPTVDLVMHSEDVFWRVFGGNSMVRIEKEGVDVWCLGFVDGGTHRRTSVVIGGYQLEDNLVQFDVESNTFGFTSSLLLQGTKCSNFNITNFPNLIK